MSLGMAIILTGLCFFLLTCVVLIDIARKDFGGIQKKALWGFTAMVPFIGPIVYLTMGYRKGKRQRNPSGGRAGAGSNSI
jgi:bacteriorhodopsin